LLKDLAIRVEQRTAISSFMSSAATELDGTRHPDRLADQGNAVSPGPALPDPVIRQPSRHRGNWLAGIAITRQQLQSVLAILPVAILSIAAVTGLFENQVSSLRTALPDNSNFSRSPATNAEDQRTIASDNAQLQRILGQELPATAAGHPQGYPLLTEAPAGPPGTPYAGTGQLHDTDELYPVDKLIPDVEVASGSETVLHSHDQFVPAEKKQHVATISSVSDNELLTDALRETEVERLLVQGQQALQDFRLLTPAQDSAYHYFQGALMLSPDNAQAIAGIEQVAERYVFLTNRALEQQDWVKARLYIDRGLSIQPGNSELLALQNSIYEPVVDTDEEIGITAKTVEDQNTDDFLSRVKAFFSAARNSARSDNETIADETSSYLHEQ
jgi:hypothetical protein